MHRSRCSKFQWRLLFNLHLRLATIEPIELTKLEDQCWLTTTTNVAQMSLDALYMYHVRTLIIFVFCCSPTSALITITAKTIYFFIVKAI